MRPHQASTDLVQTHYAGVIGTYAPAYGTGIPYADRVLRRRNITPPDGRWREGSIVATAFVLCLVGGSLHVDDTVGLPPVGAYLLAAVSAVALLGRHGAPVAVLVATSVCGMLAEPLGVLATPLVVAPSAIGAYALALRTEPRVTIPVLVPCAVSLIVLTPFVASEVSWEDISRLGTVVATPLVAAVFGRSTRHRRAYLEMMEERARRAEENRDSEAGRKVAEERVRIARELHDLVAHQLTLANAQAAVAVHLFDSRPNQARESLGELVTTTRQALDELRGTVGLLRHTDDASVEPAPGLAQFPGLLESFHRAGLDVTVHEDGTPETLLPAVDLTAYRIVQEALTNVAKHADTDNADVRLTWTAQHLTITVTDNGGGSRTPLDRQPGYGLIGMRERATAIGGTLEARTRPEGGFRVTAELPLSALADTERGSDQ